MVPVLDTVNSLNTTITMCPNFWYLMFPALRLLVVSEYTSERDTDYQAAKIMPPKLRCASLMIAELPMR